MPCRAGPDGQITWPSRTKLMLAMVVSATSLAAITSSASS
jgi:hypothetical protein